VDHHLLDVIITRIEVTYRDGRSPDVLEVDQYAFSRLAIWARQNGMAGLSPDTAKGSAEQLLCMQVMCWATATRGSALPPPFDEWLASVVDMDAVEAVEVDPTPATT
jgi:hypothetical protein